MNNVDKEIIVSEIKRLSDMQGKALEVIYSSASSDERKDCARKALREINNDLEEIANRRK